MGSAKKPEIADEALMRRYQQGDLSAFAMLVSRHQTPLYNFVLRQLHAPDTAEDVVQEVFVRIVENANSFKHEARFTTWAYTIARNLCIDHLRRASFRRHVPLDSAESSSNGAGGGPQAGQVPDPHPHASTERAAVCSEIQHRLLAAVGALPSDQKEVFLLREIANLPFQEIAKVTGAPENTVKSRMRYALERLQAALTDFEEYARALR